MTGPGSPSGVSSEGDYGRYADCRVLLTPLSPPPRSRGVKSEGVERVASLILSPSTGVCASFAAAILRGVA